MKRKQLLLLLALLMTAATGAWAQTTYTVAGDNAAMFGSAWDADYTANDMTKNADGTYSITYTNVYLDADVTYRVVKDRNWGEAYPAYNRVINIAEAGTYTLTIHFNPTTHEVYETMPGSGSGEVAPTDKHLITGTYDKQTRSLEQPLPYATTVGELYEAVTGQSFSYLISYMSLAEMPLTRISSNTSVVSIGELNGASTPVTVNADGKATIGLIFGSYAQAIFVSVTPPLYVTMKDGVKDADKWTVKVGDGQAQALPIGGLKGDGSETVTLQYSGRLKVKGVKATSDAAPSVPDGAINGKFSVSDTKQVYFSKGNLRYASGAWSFFDNQYDYYNSYSADAWDHFGWSTSATTYGMNTSESNSTYSGDFVDWGATMGTGWFTLSSAEWTYLFNTRTVNGGTGSGKSYTLGQSVNGKLGVVIYPDNYTGEVYSGSDWATFESAGCVFLPAAGYRSGSLVDDAGASGLYWSATPNGTDRADRVSFYSGNLYPVINSGRNNAYSVRLVREVTE